MATTIPGGTVHPLPQNLKAALTASPKAMAVWQDITPLARNEWICLVTSAAQDKTTQRRLKRTIDQLSRGQRRPCCWIGCIHRKDKPMSASVKWALGKR